MYLLIWLDSGSEFNPPVSTYIIKRCKTLEEMVQSAELLEAGGNEIVAHTKILSAVDIAAAGMEVPVIKIEKL